MRIQEWRRIELKFGVPRFRSPFRLPDLQVRGVMSTQEALSKKIADWLERTGLPLELDAVSRLQAAGFVVEHSPVFADPQSEKGREIDVVASTRDPLGLLYLFVVAECKATPNPWVVLVDPSKPARLSNDCLGVTDPRCLDHLPDDFFSRSEFSYRLRAQQTGGYLLRHKSGVKSCFATCVGVMSAHV